MKTANEILQLINRYIDEMPYNRQPASLYEPIRYILSLGGKRIRPTLMMLAYNLYQEDPESILPQACALETYHNFTLLHDDLMDHADMRRGNPTVHVKWDANTAILSGDTMLLMAFKLMMQCPQEYLHAVLDVFTETTLEIDEGQQYDISFETRDDVREEEYIEMIRLKTSVLLACALKIGAILGGASASDAENLYKFGEQIGLAFQLQDDFLDVYGDPKVFGKAIGGDILCNKKTFMLINAFNKADEAQRKELEKWVNAVNPDPQQKIVAVTTLYNNIGVNRLAEERIRYYFDESRKYLAAVQVPEESKQELKAYTDKMMKRNK
ncbi:MAG: polyprenyl synthetase family protein [Prevotella sp.]|nr:polyprenyl synthetase family protein [Prevotella sp.]